MAEKLETIVLGAGCFWCTEATFATLKGVMMVSPGYAGGGVKNPTYEQVASGKTGHAEVIKISYDANMITLEALLDVFFSVHDPTTLNRQGGDVGEQYRSLILYTTEEQRTGIKEFMKKLAAEKRFKDPIVTEIKKLEEFYGAENYHKDYYAKNPHKPYCQAVISPKLSKMKEKFGSLQK